MGVQFWPMTKTTANQNTSETSTSGIAFSVLRPFCRVSLSWRIVVLVCGLSTCLGGQLRIRNEKPHCHGAQPSSVMGVVLHCVPKDQPSVPAWHHCSPARFCPLGLSSIYYSSAFVFLLL